MGHENCAQCKFYVYVSTDATADAASCWTLAVFILTLEKSEPKIWIHIKHCLSSAKVIPIQEALKVHSVDATASDAEHFVSDAWLTPRIYFETFCFELLGTTLQVVYNMQTRFI